MFVVLWIHKEDLFCVPLYSWNGRGIMSRPESIRHEFVEIRNSDDDEYVHEGKHPEVEVKTIGNPLKGGSCVHITGGIKIACNVDIHFSGRMPHDSFYRLLNLWRHETHRARSEPWREIGVSTKV